MFDNLTTAFLILFLIVFILGAIVGIGLEHFLFQHLNISISWN